MRLGRRRLGRQTGQENLQLPGIELLVLAGAEDAARQSIDLLAKELVFTAQERDQRQRFFERLGRLIGCACHY